MSYRCRVCMADVDADKKKSIFDIGVDNLRISDMIRSCTTLEILETDAFSKIICPSCLEKVINIYTFKQTVLRLNEGTVNFQKEHKKCTSCKEKKTKVQKANVKPTTPTPPPTPTQSPLPSPSVPAPPPPRETLICSICKKKFKHSRTLSKHQKIHASA